uniref:Uncharacterized protein n=1 Tax=Romanomermis culicivorax TaxID=13658 RepID=A0A915KZ41_ROMCU
MEDLDVDAGAAILLRGCFRADYILTFLMGLFQGIRECYSIFIGHWTSCKSTTLHPQYVAIYEPTCIKVLAPIVY